MARVLVLGATGRTGAAVLGELPSDTVVTAALRRPTDRERLPRVAAEVTSAVVDLNDVRSIGEAARGADVIVNAVRLRDDIDPTALVELHGRIADAARSAGERVPLIVTVGGAGAVRLEGGLRFWQRPAFPAGALPRGVAHARLRDHLEAGRAGARWAYLVPPPRFDPDGPPTGHYEAWRPSGPEDGFTRRAISYADFAAATATAVSAGWTGTMFLAWPDPVRAQP